MSDFKHLTRQQQIAVAPTPWPIMVALAFWYAAIFAAGICQWNPWQ